MVSTPQLTRDLRTALATGTLSIAFQPQYDLDTAASHDGASPGPAAVEALCRWDHAVLGAIAPDRFIPLAEHGEFLDEVDVYVFARAAEQVARWREAGFVVGLAVNASPAHFSTRYADAVLARLEQSHLDPSGVTIEITEAPLPQLRPGMLSAIEELHALGIAISVDDFAAGGDDVAVLEVLPIDEVKIDRSLIQRTDAAAEDAIASIVAASVEHGWRVVAEGIETVADLERARSRGCHRGQGYLWGMPLPVDEMEGLLSRA